jgi:Anti-sigma-28 factor, FlgM
VSASGDHGEPVNLHRIDRELRRRVADGEYVVDPHAVAEAMIRRARLNEAQRFSRMLEAAKLKRLAGSVEQS